MTMLLFSPLVVVSFSFQASVVSVKVGQVDHFANMETFRATLDFIVMSLGYLVSRVSVM